MRATELMVGDWVLDGKKPAQITGIMCDDLFETTLSPSVGGECISPIPLTHEILKKNGFSLQSDNTEFLKLDTYWLGCELGTFRFIILTKTGGSLDLLKSGTYTSCSTLCACVG